MKLHKWSDIKREFFTPEQIARIDANVKRDLLEMQLGTLRDAAGKTQQEVADAAQMVQSEISRTERRDDHLVSTLRRYVDALGGELEICAVIKGQRIKLVGV